MFVLHDVGWPYGRRDGYYAPKQIPRRYRRPNAQLGLERGNAGLLAEGGPNRNIWNAKLEGGKRNGVLTAVEDFLADHPSEFREVVLDLYVGLAIVAPVSRLAIAPSSPTSWIASTPTPAGSNFVTRPTKWCKRRSRRGNSGSN